MTLRRAADPKIRPHPGYDGTAGVSEVIGAILLVGLVVAAVAVVAVTLFSQTTPEKVPNVNFMVGTDNHVPPTLYLTHNGGDTLASGSFSVYVDGNVRPYSIAGGGNQWSLGKNLLVPLSSGEAPQRIYLVYNQTGTGSSVIGSASANVSVPSGKVAPDVIIPPTSGGTSTVGYVFNDAANISNSSYFVQAIQQNLTRDSIFFWKTNFAKGTGASGLACDGICNSNTYKNNFTFTVTDTTSSSSISYGSITSPTKVSLKNGDVVTISLARGSVIYLTSFGIAPQIGEFAAKPVYIYIKFANGTTLSTAKNIELLHTSIGSYSNLDSTLVLDVWQNSDTALTVNGTQVINGADSKDIMITNVRPVPIGLYLINVDTNNNNLVFVGDADGIYFNNVRQTLP
jgi:hypothetical protein